MTLDHLAAHVRIAQEDKTRAMDDFKEKMRAARGVAKSVRAGVASARRAAIRDAEDIIARGELLHQQRAELDQQRKHAALLHHSAMDLDRADIVEAKRELAEFAAEIAEFSNGFPLDDGEPSGTDGSPLEKSEPEHPVDDGSAYNGTNPEVIKAG